MYQSHRRKQVKRHEQDSAAEDLIQPFKESEPEETSSSWNSGGQPLYFGYNKIILDLLKDPVSLGMHGSNSNRGHQR